MLCGTIVQENCNKQSVIWYRKTNKDYISLYHSQERREDVLKQRGKTDET